MITFYYLFDAKSGWPLRVETEAVEGSYSGSIDHTFCLDADKPLWATTSLEIAEWNVRTPNTDYHGDEKHRYDRPFLHDSDGFALEVREFTTPTHKEQSQ